MQCSKRNKYRITGYLFLFITGAEVRRSSARFLVYFLILYITVPDRIFGYLEAPGSGTGNFLNAIPTISTIAALSRISLFPGVNTLPTEADHT